MARDDTIHIRLDHPIGAALLGQYVLDLLERDLWVTIEPSQFLVERREARRAQEKQDEGE
jgi:hypothetical protein